MNLSVKRRRFIQMGAAGLIVGCASDGAVSVGPAVGDGTPLQTWLWISEDNVVTIAMHKAEMGQGVHTTLPLLVAEELDVNLDQVKVKLVPELGDFSFGGLPLTYGSTSVATCFLPFRKVGAAARAVLIQAAAARWSVSVEAITTNAGTCMSADGRTLTYGELAQEASALTAPDEPPLKSPTEYRLIGKDQPRLADESIVNGTAVYGIDSVQPGGLYAAIRHAPSVGGEPQNVDALTSGDPAVRKIVALPGAVAVVATSFWSAKKAVESLPVEFSSPKADEQISSASLRAALAEGLDADGTEVVAQGDAVAALAAANKTLTAEYEVPHIAHFPMEPVNATVHVTSERCDVWLPTQGASFVRDKVSELTGLDADRVFVHPTFIGGGFGRKAATDYVEAAVRVAQVVDGPVTMIWSREEDTRRDHFRPAFAGRLTGGLDESGKLVVADAINCGDSVLGFGEGDPLSPQGLSDAPYAIAAQRVRHVYVPSPIQSGFWRSIGHSQNTFFTESFIDEMAHLAEADPIAFRLDLLGDNPRTKAVLERVATLGNWGEPFTPGASQGVAVCASYGSFVAAIAEVSVDEEKTAITVHRFSAVADCGVVVQPGGVKAQIEGGLIFGLSAGLKEEISFEQGATQQSNFSNYQVLYPAESPLIEVELVQSTEDPGGAGELSVGVATPAVANAIFAASQKRLRTLPLEKALAAMSG